MLYVLYRREWLININTPYNLDIINGNVGGDGTSYQSITTRQTINTNGIMGIRASKDDPKVDAPNNTSPGLEGSSSETRLFLTSASSEKSQRQSPENSVCGKRQQRQRISSSFMPKKRKICSDSTEIDNYIQDGLSSPTTDESGRATATEGDRHGSLCRMDVAAVESLLKKPNDTIREYVDGDCSPLKDNRFELGLDVRDNADQHNSNSGDKEITSWAPLLRSRRGRQSAYSRPENQK